MGESFVADAEAMGYPADWDGGGGGALADRIRYLESCHEKPIEEIKSDESVDWLTKRLRCHCFTGDVDGVDIVRQHFPRDSCFIPFKILLGPQQEIPESQYYFECDHLRFHIRDFVEALRHSRVPVEFDTSMPPLIWDTEAQSPRIIPRTWDSNPDIPDFVKRSWLTSDHGRKLILARKKELHSRYFTGAIPLRMPDFIPNDECVDYCLVYHDKCGIPKSIEMTSFRDMQVPIVTRTGIYVYRNDGFESLSTNCFLQANAFRIVIESRPEDLQLYSLRDTATVFEPGVDRFELRNLRSHTHSIESLWEYLEDLKSQVDEQKALLTAGGHPSDVGFEPFQKLFVPRSRVTSIRYYKMALEVAADVFGSAKEAFHYLEKCWAR